MSDTIRQVDTDPREFMLLGASEFFADRGENWGSNLSRMETGDLLNLRYDLTDHFDLDVETPRGSLLSELVEAIEHEIGGRWVTPGHAVGEAK